MSEQAFGIDIGGSGIKGAVVDLSTGALITERRRIETPRPAKPDALAAVIAELVAAEGWTGRVGCTFPGVIHSGVVKTAVNLHPSWNLVDADALFSAACGCEVTIVNDADAAGLAEVRYGDPALSRGVALLLTFGTGIGSALLLDGKLVPNTELGHLEVDGHGAETRASAAAREREDLSWSQWAPRVDRYLRELEKLFSPDQFIIGGGVSKKSEKWFPLLTISTPVSRARLGNDAGIVGAAIVGATGHAPA